MIRYSWLLILIPILGIMSMKDVAPEQGKTQPLSLKWYTWQEAVELNKKAPRKLLVDMYTDWCGWCKRMDKETFENDTITSYLNKYFYCVKFNAEGHDSLSFMGSTFKWISPEQGGGRNGVHQFAYTLLDGNMAYPTFVYLNEKYERITISPGYKVPSEILPLLHFVAQEKYLTKTYAEFLQEKN